jgi:hypothetical protein
MPLRSYSYDVAVIYREPDTQAKTLWAGSVRVKAPSEEEAKETIKTLALMRPEAREGAEAVLIRPTPQP